MDFGLMDSHKDLGLNSPEESRFQLQHKLHCAPLVTYGYETNYIYKGTSFILYQYSQDIDPGSDCNCTLALRKRIIEESIEALSTPFLESGADFRLV